MCTINAKSFILDIARFLGLSFTLNNRNCWNLRRFPCLWYQKLSRKNSYWGYSQGKHAFKQNTSVYEKYEYRHLDGWYIKSTIYERFLHCSKIFKKKKVVNGKIQFFVIGLFCTSYSICLNIGFWQVSFFMEKLRFQTYYFH